MGVEIADFGTSAKVFRDQNKPRHVYGGFGEGLRAWALRPGLPCDDTTGDPTEFTTTVVEGGGGGDSTMALGVVQGYPLLLTTDNADFDGINAQLKGASAKCVAAKPWILRAKVKASVAALSDLLFGMCTVKSDLLKTSDAHGVQATGVEGVFIFKAAGASSTTLYLKSYVAGAETASVAIGTLGTADIDLALEWDGARLHAFVDDVEKAVISSGLPTVVLTPSINFRTGAAAAITLSVAELGYVSAE